MVKDTRFVKDKASFRERLDPLPSVGDSTTLVCFSMINIDPSPWLSLYPLPPFLSFSGASFAVHTLTLAVSFLTTMSKMWDIFFFRVAKETPLAIMGQRLVLEGDHGCQDVFSFLDGHLHGPSERECPVSLTSADINKTLGNSRTPLPNDLRHSSYFAGNAAPCPEASANSAVVGLVGRTMQENRPSSLLLKKKLAACANSCTLTDPA
ncbi:hypothetical protein J3F83DRAFT_741208, partial [Trichoderma novae-zelandiae]